MLILNIKTANWGKKGFLQYLPETLVSLLPCFHSTLLPTGFYPQQLTFSSVTTTFLFLGVENAHKTKGNYVYNKLP